MIYVYDVVLNLNSNLIEYFEWEEKDNIKYIRKIPFYKINKTTMNDFIKNNVVVDKDFLDKIYDKCKLEENYNNDYKYLCLFTDGNLILGVSFNKIFAKLGSDMKKPDAVTQITVDNFREKVWPLAASELIYVGRATEAKLARYGVQTVGDLAAIPPDTLKRWFGINGLKLWAYANGTDNSRVMHRDFVSPVKSIGHGITCTADLENEEEVHKVLLELAQDVGHRLRVHDLCAQGVQVSVRGNDLLGAQFQCKLPFRTQLPSEIACAGFRLFKERYRWGTNVRAVCIRAIDLVPKSDIEQLSIFVDTARRDRRARLEDAIEGLRDRYGKRAITYATLMGDLKMPDDGRHSVKMPGLMYQ